MKKITKIAVIYSGTRKTDNALLRVNEIIESSNSEVILSTNIKKLNSETIKQASKAELILVLGGDGTMIGSIRNLHSLNVPFLGINSGTVGFLTDLSLSKIEKLKDILQGHYLKESRPVFEKILAYLLAPMNADCYSKFEEISGHPKQVFDA